VDECKPLTGGGAGGGGAGFRSSPAPNAAPNPNEAGHSQSIRGLHSSTVQRNLRALHWTGGARRGCVSRVKGVVWGVRGVYGVSMCQTRLKLS